MIKAVALFFSIMVFLTGCNSQPEPNQRPAWVLNPNTGNKNGAVGVAGRTYDQKVSTKRKLAITRALDELSLQSGVKVELSIDKREVVSNDRANTHMDTQSNYAASSNITAHIEDIWEDTRTGELYVWMVMD